MMRRLTILALTAAFAVALNSCGGDPKKADAAKRAASKPIGQDARSAYKVGRPYTIAGQRHAPRERFRHRESGRASWYGPGFHGKHTANGEIFDKRALTAAHRTLQLPSIVRVTNTGNGKSAVLRVNDRGPYHGDRVLDVSEAAAEALGFRRFGVAFVQIEVLETPSREVARLAREGARVATLEAVRAAAEAGPQPMPTRPERNVQLAEIGKEVGGRRVEATSPSAPMPSGQAPSGQAPSGQASSGQASSDQTTAAPATASPAPGALTFIQAGAFADLANARRLEAKIHAFGETDVVSTLIGGRTIYRVRLGPYVDVADAEVALAQVATAGASGAHLVVVQ